MQIRELLLLGGIRTFSVYIRESTVGLEIFWNLTRQSVWRKNCWRDSLFKWVCYNHFIAHWLADIDIQTRSLNLLRLF